MESDVAIAQIQKKLGVENDEWFPLLGLFADIPDDFAEYAAEWPRVNERRDNLAAALRECAAAIESNDISRYWTGPAPWMGLFLPFIDFPEMITIFSTFQRVEPNPHGRQVFLKAFAHVAGKDAFIEMPTLLRRFADSIDQLLEEPIAKSLAKTVSRKNSLREFAKRRVFQILTDLASSRAAPSKRAPSIGNLLLVLRDPKPKIARAAPNKETATIVNCLLELTGSGRVTANDISQMNKRKRSRRIAT